MGQAIANQVGIDYVLAEVLPQDKANIIKQLQQGLKIGNLKLFENWKLKIPAKSGSWQWLATE